jgi:hypothetical protein
MFSKLNCWVIIVDHAHTLKRFGEDRVSYWECVLFFASPLAIPVGLLLSQKHVDDPTVNVIVTAASIFAGLLLNLLVLLYTYATRLGDMVVRLDTSLTTGQRDRWRRIHALVGELLANISFSILSAVLLVICCLLFPKDLGLISRAIECTICYLTSIMVLSLFIVLKRIHMLLKTEVAEIRL